MNPNETSASGCMINLGKKGGTAGLDSRPLGREFIFLTDGGG